MSSYFRSDQTMIEITVGYGSTDKIAVLRGGNWFLDYSGNGYWGSGDVFCSFGINGDKPVAGDWNGDGKDEIGILRGGD